MNKAVLLMAFFHLIAFTSVVKAVHKRKKPTTEIGRKADAALHYMSTRYKKFSIIPKDLIDLREVKEGSGYLPNEALQAVMNSLSPRSQAALRDIDAAGYYASFAFGLPVVSSASAGVGSSK